jgi:dTDP-4-amino-4,6-dideoxygalactose transaminase
MIEKEASGDKNSLRLIRFTNSFRDGLQQVLQRSGRHSRILVPAYVGLSLVEGSGVLDPIKNSKANFSFYEVDKYLDPVISSLKREIQVFQPSHVLVINYFGFLISNREEVFELLRLHGVVTIEDFAHLLAPLRNRRQVKNLADIEIYSLHKTIGSNFGGGAVCTNFSSQQNIRETISTADCVAYAHADLDYIAKKRIRNYNWLNKRFHSINQTKCRFFFDDGRKPILPLNYPVRLISSASRHSLYTQLRTGNVFPTALYHRLVPDIKFSDFPVSAEVSGTILNLPVHQDVELHQLKALMQIVEKFSNE